jgi:hypothetical protein
LSPVINQPSRVSNHDGCSHGVLQVLPAGQDFAACRDLCASDGTMPPGKHHPLSGKNARLDSVRFEVQFVFPAWVKNTKTSFFPALNNLFVNSVIHP